MSKGCGCNLGHGLSCTKDYLCDSCAKVERLEDLLDTERRMFRKLNDQLAAANARADNLEPGLRYWKGENPDEI